MLRKSSGLTQKNAHLIPFSTDDRKESQAPSSSSKKIELLLRGKDDFLPVQPQLHQSSQNKPHGTNLQRKLHHVDEKLLQHALNRLRQTRSIQQISQALQSEKAAQHFAAEPATLQSLQMEGESLLTTLEQKKLPSHVLTPLQQSIRQLTGNIHATQTLPLSDFSQSLHGFLQQLLTLSNHPEIKKAQTQPVPTQNTRTTTKPAQNTRTTTKDIPKASTKLKKKKSIWEKIGDFLKKALQVLMKIFDLLSPLLNLIPGVGSAIFAAYQGVKFIVGLVKGNVAEVIGALASVAGGVGSAVSGVAGSVLKIASKAVQVGHSLAQAIESKNPLAILGALGSVSGSLGQVGKSLGSLGKGAAQIGKGLAQAAQFTQKGLQIATAGATFIDGAAKGNPDQALSGLTGMMGATGSLVGGTTQQVLQHASQGVTAIQNIAQGRYGAALQGFANTLTPLSQFPEARETLGYVQSGMRLVGDLTSGNFDRAIQRITHQASLFQKQEPHLNQTIQRLKPTLGFINSLTLPQTAQNLRQMTQNWQQVNQQPDFRQAMRWSQQLGQSMEQLPTHQPERLLSQVQLLSAVQQYQQAYESGRLEQGIHAYCEQLQQHLKHPSMKQVSQWLKTGHQALYSLTSGQAQSAIQELQQSKRFQQNSDLTIIRNTLNEGQQFIQSLLSKRLGKLLGQLQEKAPSLLEQETYLNFLKQTSSLKECLKPIHSGEAHKQLQHIKETLQQITPSTLSNLLITV